MISLMLPYFSWEILRSDHFTSEHNPLSWERTFGIYSAVRHCIRSRTDTVQVQLPFVKSVVTKRVLNSSSASWFVDFKTDLRFQSSCCFSKGKWGLLGWSLRGHQLVRYPSQESHHHAKGHPVSKENSRRESLNAVLTFSFVNNEN